MNGGEQKTNNDSKGMSKGTKVFIGIAVAAVVVVIVVSVAGYLICRHKKSHEDDEPSATHMYLV